MEQAAEQQGWVQGAEPLAITSITATAGGVGNMDGEMDGDARL